MKMYAGNIKLIASFILAAMMVSACTSREEKVAEMKEIVQDMYITYWNRINSNMLRFTDDRLLKWVISKASQYEYIPVMGAGETIFIKRTPVTNSEYYKFVKEKDINFLQIG